MIFEPMPKIARWYRDIVVTEKLDGTNASIWITDSTRDLAVTPPLMVVPGPAGSGTCFWLRAGSRNRFITPKDDNHGFSRWVCENADALLGLGEGTHHGEWWGRGIQRGYDLPGKRFSLFNTGRWALLPEFDGQEAIPEVPGLDVVPVLYRGPLIPASEVDPVQEALRRLSYGGSIAAPGYMRPEGVVVWHEAGRIAFKSTLDGDGHKGAR